MDSPGDDPGDRDGSMARPDPGRGDNGNELSHKYQGPQWDQGATRNQEVAQN